MYIYMTKGSVLITLHNSQIWKYYLIFMLSIINTTYTELSFFLNYFFFHALRLTNQEHSNISKSCFNEDENNVFLMWIKF